MASGNFSRHVNSHSDGESPTQSDIGVAAMNGCRWIICRKQNDHGDDARAEENEDEGSEELGDQFGNQCWWLVHSGDSISEVCFRTASSLARIRRRATPFTFAKKKKPASLTIRRR